MKLAPQNSCSGCTACQSICPKSTISMLADNEGFLYPKVDESKCVQCGLCEKVCPSLNRELPRTPLAVYAAKAKDDELRLKSSSGGVFSLLARQVFARGGVVYGAGFDHSDWHVMHKSAENEDELEDLRGSKYVQSDVQGIYAAVRNQLLAGREVLFSGTPCQVAGLRRYLKVLQVDMAKLLLVDVVCHAAPSPLVWRKYIEEQAMRDGVDATLSNVAFRNKTHGWARYSLALDFSDGKHYSADLFTDPFLRGFQCELYSRMSCYDCSCRELRSGSDLTIADYWRIHEKFPEMDDARGTSLVLVNTDAGEQAWGAIARYLSNEASDFADAVRVNPSLVKSAIPHPRRKDFFDCIDRGRFDLLIAKMLKRPLWRRAVSRCKRLVAGQ